MAVPKLRFKEFNTDYTNTTFEKLKGFSIQSGKSEEKGDTGEFPFYGSTGVIGYKDIFDYEGKSILIARVGANAGSLYQIDGKYSVSDNTLRLTVSDDTSLDYLRELLIKFNLNRLVFGTGQPLVTGGMIKKVNISIPEFTEQTKIASFLSNVDEKISQLTQKLELLSQYKQGMMQKLFSQQIRFKADDGSEFGEWEEKIIGEIANIKRGASPRPITDTKWFDEDSKVGWVRISDVSKSKKVLVETEQYLSIAGIKKSRFIPKGNIIMSICATIGKPIYTGFDVCIHDGFVVFSELKAWHEYTYYYLEYIEKNWYQYGQPGTQVNLNSDIVSNEIFPFPCLEEQTKIANFLSAIDQKIEVVAQQIEQAKQWKKGLLQNMFI